MKVRFCSLPSARIVRLMDAGSLVYSVSPAHFLITRSMVDSLFRNEMPSCASPSFRISRLTVSLPFPFSSFTVTTTVHSLSSKL